MSAPDVETVPNFDAVRARIEAPSVLRWLAKLEEWCKLSVEERDRLEKSAERLDDEKEDLERALAEKRDAEEFLEQITQRIEDTERGIYTLQETADWLRRENR